MWRAGSVRGRKGCLPEGRRSDMARKSRKKLNGAVGKVEKAVLFRAGLYARLSYESGVNRHHCKVSRKNFLRLLLPIMGR